MFEPKCLCPRFSSKMWYWENGYNFYVFKLLIIWLIKWCKHNFFLDKQTYEYTCTLKECYYYFNVHIYFIYICIKSKTQHISEYIKTLADFCNSHSVDCRFQHALPRKEDNDFIFRVSLEYPPHYVMCWVDPFAGSNASERIGLRHLIFIC